MLSASCGVIMANETIPFLQTFRSLVITNAEGKEYNISSMVSEVSIYSDLFSNVLTGEVLIAESQGGLTHMGIVGRERLTIEIYRGESATIREFYVYAVSDRYGVNAQSEVYKLHFISLEAILNENTRLYQAFNGTNSSSVKSAFSLLGSTKPLHVEDTIGTFKSVMPGWTPFQAINWYAGRSRGAEKSSLFLLYENMEGFSFSSIDTLCKQDATITLHQSPTSTQVATKDPWNIRELSIERDKDTLSGFKEDFTTLWNSDLVRKKIVKQRFEGVDDDNGFDIDFKSRRDVFGSNIIVRNETQKTHTQTRDYRFDMTQEKQYQMRFLSNEKMRCLLHGNWGLDAGMVVDVALMAKTLQTKSNRLEDGSINGKHLVTAVRYVMKAQDFHMSVETVRIGS